MTRSARLEWEGFEVVERGFLRAIVGVVGARRTRVAVRVSLDGHVCDLQADDCDYAGTTGEPALDQAVCELVTEHLTLARDAAAYAQAQRHRDVYMSPLRKARR